HPCVSQLAHLADIVQENAHQYLVTIQFGVEWQQALGAIEKRYHVLEQTPQVRMVIPHSGRNLPIVLQELVVHQKAFGQGTQVRIRQAHKRAAQPLEQLVDVLLGVRQKISQFNLLRLATLDVAEDDLQRPLE